jgi:beta-mannanase
MKQTSQLIAVSSAILLLAGSALGANKPLGFSSGGAPGGGELLDKRPVVTSASLDFGAYDPHGDFGKDDNVGIEHLFLPWEDVDLSSLALADEYARQRGRSLLITVEPWSWSLDWKLSPEELHDGIMNGRYDANIAAICSEAAKLKSAVTIRWGQEMDEPDGQFTWAYWNAPQFVAAYRHVVSECRKHFESAQFMWSPKGNEGLEAYYPGDPYVDIVGLSVFGLQQYDNDMSGADRTFSELLEPGYGRVEGFGKPVVVAELGYEGNDVYVRNWANDVAQVNPAFPQLQAIIYFNDREVHPWPHGYGKPDWRVVRHVPDQG